MTLDKAIEILQVELVTSEHQSDPDFYDALFLGIQALKREKFNRDNQRLVIYGKLPGETPAS